MPEILASYGVGTTHWSERPTGRKDPVVGTTYEVVFTGMTTWTY
jgi:hypothetical protein